MMYRNTWLLFILCIAMFAQAVSGQNKADSFTSHVISWDMPEKAFDGDEPFHDVLFFPGSTYSDSLPGIPAFSYHEKNDIPLYGYAYELDDAMYAPVSDEVDGILRSAGFKQAAPELLPGRIWERKQSYSAISFYPFRYDEDTDTYEKLVSFRLNKKRQFDAELTDKLAQSYTTNSVLANGSWHKVCVDQTGIYRLSYADFVSLGIPVQGLQKSQIRLFGNGGGMLPEANDAFRYDDLIENAIFVSGSADGVFAQNDYVLFYGQSPNKWTYNQGTGFFDHQVHLYATENCYFITTNQGSGKRIAQQASVTEGATHQINQFQDYTYHQQDLLNLIGSGRTWYGELFEGTLSRDFDFPFSDLDVSGPARVSVSLAARSPVPSSFVVTAGNNDGVLSIPSVDLDDYNNFHAREGLFTMNFSPIQSNNVRVRVAYNRPASTSRGWLSYIALNVTRQLRYTGSQITFRNSRNIGAGHVAEYVLGNAPAAVTVWDVTDRFNIKRQEVTQSGANQLFRLTNQSLREFVAFNGSDFLKPRLAGAVGNQNLHGMSTVDMIIVSPDMFLHEAGRLGSFRSENDGLSIAIVSTQQVYNEFSSGTPDASAIRNFMKMFHDRATHAGDMPRYLLLFGNGTIDNKNKLGFGGNLIPTYQSLASLSPSNSFMTDDYFGLLADNEGDGANGMLDIGIGRLPVRTVEEATQLVDKIIRYDKRMPEMDPTNDDVFLGGRISNYADWRNMVVFVADDGDFNTHFSHAERLTSIVRDVHPYYNLEKIYMDSYPLITLAGGSRYPDVNRAINSRVNQGALLINYIGHGGPKGLAHERVVTFDDIATWNNLYNMPVFMTATCEFSSFDQPDPELLSAGVRILLKPDGGAVALYTTTRLAWAGTNLTLNENFMRSVFARDDSGQYPRLGDLIRIAKVKSHGMVQPWRLKNFVLLGDPSMQMAYPKYQVITQEIPDTIKAFQQATVTGYVADHNGNKLTGYNGVIFPTVFDKYNDYQTLANASGSNKANFAMRNSLLYKGKASVVNGDFSFTFVIPKDISYKYDTGKISYYADDGLFDAHGHFTNFIIGGTLENYAPDDTGPEIRLFMNDTTFVSGGKTNENPVLLAYVSDVSGINIAGRIGHDIVAFLNDQMSQPIVLNSYYEADKDSYQTGRVAYPFSRLEDGHYTVTLRVWDIHNNPSSESIDFVVARSAQMVLENLMNYPNPLSHSGTNFVFSHNLPYTDLDVQIDVFDLQGRRLKTLRNIVQSAGFQSPEMHWDGTSDGGHKLGNGVYIYRVQMTSPNGQKAYQTEKLVIVRE
jgi:hypothetical protein